MSTAGSLLHLFLLDDHLGGCGATATAGTGERAGIGQVCHVYIRRLEGALLQLHPDSDADLERVGHTVRDAGLHGQVQHQQNIGDDVERRNKLLREDVFGDVQDLCSFVLAGCTAIIF